MIDDATAIHELVEAQTVRTPDAIAVIAGDVTLTYAELIRRSRQLGHALRALGAGPEVRIGVTCARTADLIVAVLGVLQSGAAYVPIDPAWPDARAALVRGDAGLRAIVGGDVPVVHPEQPTHRLDPAVTPATACCLLYTSGSTGQPKGVVIEHGAIANRLRWAEDTYPYAPGEIAAARTPLGFVDSLAEIFAPLACGVPLVVLDPGRDLAALVAALADARATRVVVVPSMLATLLALYPDLGARLPALRWWFVGGEAVPVAVVRAFFRAAPGRKLINIYGATEVSGDATAYDFDDLPDDAVHAPIGKALRRCGAEIVDGEIVVTGACVARGYVGQPRFGGRYRTGDLGRVLPTGDLECHGRRDAQVKIAGVRVELGEVEAAIAGVPGVARVAALAREVRPGERALVAYYAGVAMPAAVRATIASRLPVVPSLLTRLDALPLNVSGKIDRRALEALPVDAGGAPPRDDRERALAEIFEAALDVAPIGRDRSFHDLGGTSLAAVRIAVAIREQLGAPVALAAIYAHPTIAALAVHVAALAPVRTRPLAIAGTPLPPELPLTDQQRPFWWFRAVSDDVSVVADVFAVTPAVEPARLAAAVADAARTIDALWMAMPRWQPVQRLQPRGGVALEILDLRAQLGVVLQREVDAVTTPRFDLASPPLLRARLVWLPGGEQRLIVAVPHVIADMTAMDVLRAAIERALAGAPPPPPGADLRDLIAWQRGLAPADDATTRGPVWTRLPARLFTALRARRRVRAWAKTPIPPALEARLLGAGRRRGVSLPITLVAAIHAAVTRLGVADPRLLLMVEHRDHPALAGLFTTLASLMPCRVRSTDDLDALVRDVARAVLDGRDRAEAIFRRPRWLLEAYLGAMVPAARGDRRVLICVNVMPEVTQPTPPSPGPIALTRRRDLPHMLRPDDLVVGADAFLSRTLQIHVTRADELAVNLYGGGFDPAALQELAEHVARALDALP